MKLAGVWCCLWLSLCCMAQLKDDFSDGDFDINPQWSGDISSFKVSGEKLQLDDSGTGIAYLSTGNQAISDASWEFTVELDFNPSARNLCRIYLVSDYPNLTSELQGYYVRIGGQQDEISLYRQDISEHIRIIDGPDGMLDLSRVEISVKVIRDDVGNWELMARQLSQPEYVLLGQVLDDKYGSSHYFGFYCHFTNSRSDGFYLDNVSVKGTALPDHQPPKMVSLEPLNNQILQIVLDEPIKVPVLTQLTIPGFGEATGVKLTGYNTWQVFFAKRFEHGISYTLEVANIQDMSGNSASLTSQFKFWATGFPMEHDVIISEMMADPSPPLQLPEAEYLEIFNRSDSAFNLLGWSLSDASQKVKLPGFMLPPESYLVLTHEQHLQQYPDELKVLGLPSWPTLNNTDDLVMLSDSTGQLIHRVAYDNSWYRSNLKQHGGWSLEMIDTRFPCSESQNWTASISNTGGSPGKMNSVNTDNPDLTPPLITSTLAIDATKFQMQFDQALSSLNNASLSLDPPLLVDTFFIENPG